MAAVLQNMFLKENLYILIEISLKFLPKSLVDNIQHWFK